MVVDPARAKSLFLNASDLTDSARRAAYLERECGEDAELRKRVEALLRANADSESTPPESEVATIASAAGGPATGVTGVHTPRSEGDPTTGRATVEFLADATPNALIAGRYTLQEKIGEGGMGEVWVAKQSEPVKRKVALKLIKQGMDSRAVLQRFEQERQALAMMDHPNIAKVLDAGMTPGGQPFFAMELVNGLPLNKFCDEARLATRDRLELFVTICQAVQHAHQKGIVHRDLKPANILITMIDGKPVPKVIDFGVAKATAGKLTDESMSTQFGAIVGTLEYMSPEQAGFSGEDIDTRADIYSLGVILYEMLTGLRPIDARRLHKAALTEMIRIIREEEPSKPSTRLSTDDALPSMAALRQVDPRKLMALLRGELDWVVMKCLEKHRERRYETASGLARDIQRYLDDEAVEARPPSAGYRFRKFLRRNQGSAIAAALVLLALLAGMAGTTFGMIRADRSRAEAVRAGRQVERSREEAIAAGRRADANAANARRAVNDYLDRITASTQLQRPGLSGLRRDLLTQALTYYEAFLHDSAKDPILRAEAADAQNRAAMIFTELGDRDRAVEAGRRAVSLYEQLIDDQSHKTSHRTRLAGSLISLGNALRSTRQSAEAIAAYRRSIEIASVIVQEQPDDFDNAANLGVARSSLAKILGNIGKVAESDSLLQKNREDLEALIIRIPKVAKPRDLLADVLHSMGDRASDRGEFLAARGLYLNCLAIREGLVHQHPDDWWQLSQLARIENELGLLHSHNGRPREAIPYLEKGRALRERLLAAEPASADLKEYLCRSLDNLGIVQNSLGKPSDAIPMLERCVEIRSRAIASSPNDAEVRGALGGSLHNLAMSHEQTGDLAEAERLYREAAMHQRKALTIQPEIIVRRSYLTNHLLGLADLLRRDGRIEEAAKLGEEAAGLWAPGQANPLTRSAVFLVACVDSIGRGDSAEKKETRDRIGRVAVSVLEKAVNGDVRALSFIQSSAQLDPIRDRDDFKALVIRLEERTRIPK